MAGDFAFAFAGTFFALFFADAIRSIRSPSVRDPAFITSAPQSRNIGDYKLEVPQGQVQLAVLKDGFVDVSNGLAVNGGPVAHDVDMAGHVAPFPRMDTNGDGFISREE